MSNQRVSRAQILLVDDDLGMRESLTELLEDDYDVDSAENGTEGLDKLKDKSFDIVLLDLSMPGMDGLEVLQAIKAHDKAIDVVMVSATDKARQAAQAIKCGAYDYVTKPFDPDAVLVLLDRLVQKRGLEQELNYHRIEAANKLRSDKIIGRSPQVLDVLKMVEKVATAPSSVLILGESGTGKEVVARALHALSPRAQHPFVAINCAAIPAELIESELFGYEKGAFTGAASRTIGKFEYAHGGTIFLDELATLRPDMQAQLLRFLQEREFTRIGSTKVIRVDVRLLAATNGNLETLVREGHFREDLYYRLNVIPISLPPLRDRAGDIPLLAEFFLAKFNTSLNKRIAGIEPEALAMMEAYPWPGNVRELQNFIERMVVLGADDQRITVLDLPFDLSLRVQGAPAKGGRAEGMEGMGLAEARNAFEREYIVRTLEECRWNQSEAARVLGVHRNTLINKMRSLGIAGC